MSGSEIRRQAMTEITNRRVADGVQTPPLSEIWASDVFDLVTMEESLSSLCSVSVSR